MINFRYRKIVHYSIIVCILLIEVAIAAFFYNEFASRKKLSFIQNQLQEINQLDEMTDQSRKELQNAQNYFQQYLDGQRPAERDAFFSSINRLAASLDRIDRYNSKTPGLKNLVKLPKTSTEELRNLKPVIDSAKEVSVISSTQLQHPVPPVRRYHPNFDYGKYDVQKQTYTDTLRKKGLFGRLKDAITGKETIRKDSTVITLKQGSEPTSFQIKREMDSLINSVNDYYIREVQRVQYTITHNKKENTGFYSAFNNLLVLSNNLVSVYEYATRDAKAGLEKELINETSDRNRMRMNLAKGAFALMFFASVLLMYLTRLSFVYESKLNAANRQIKENLNFKNRILGMLSHELRSPLKIMGIFLKRIGKRTSDEQIKDYLKSINFTNNTLLMQANQILEYTRNQQVENRLIPVNFNLRQEITSILTAIEPYIETRNNRFVIHENISPDIEVFTDNTKLNQIFMNILGNANKFTENGTISVEIITHAPDNGAVVMDTTITDTGAGISQSDLENIFEPFYQGILSDEVENLGAGLGLSLCKEIVELYGGTISAESTLNEGTTVHFSVRLKLST
ncbi:HAMP domain-containing sensor histidine kinase [Weeksellaceae bacterium A-14]